MALDSVRGLAIVLMILGHCIQCGSGAEYLSRELFYDNWIYKIIYSFHMPLFALVSGYFIYPSLVKYGGGILGKYS